MVNEMEQFNMKISELKQQTLNEFSGKWLQAILIAVPYFIVAVIGSLPFLPYEILSIFAVIGMSYSYLEWFRFKDIPKKPLFKSLNEILNTPNQFGPFLVGILVEIYTILWSLLFLIPGIIKALAYSQALLIYKDKTLNGTERPGFNDCITKSREMMNGHKWELFVLNLSFLGWFFLSILTVGIGFIWLIPYYYGTLVNYYDYLKNNNK
ncbi:DUF975 family protein [Fructilactobacillus lindneri]|uniref:DUF975 family protein n=1 Tax=Fructilactobacillus lindneri TaxID=53444 RepID=UPI001CDB3B3C|nr:DUF975 family protein [Fructilactobacillus lindneri]